MFCGCTRHRAGECARPLSCPRALRAAGRLGRLIRVGPSCGLPKREPLLELDASVVGPALFKLQTSDDDAGRDANVLSERFDIVVRYELAELGFAPSRDEQLRGV